MNGARGTADAPNSKTELSEEDQAWMRISASIADDEDEVDKGKEIQKKVGDDDGETDSGSVSGSVALGTIQAVNWSTVFDTAPSAPSSSSSSSSFRPGSTDNDEPIAPTGKGGGRSGGGSAQEALSPSVTKFDKIQSLLSSEEARLAAQLVDAADESQRAKIIQELKEVRSIIQDTSRPFKAKSALEKKRTTQPMVHRDKIVGTETESETSIPSVIKGKAALAHTLGTSEASGGGIRSDSFSKRTVEKNSESLSRSREQIRYSGQTNRENHITGVYSVLAHSLTH